MTVYYDVSKFEAAMAIGVREDALYVAGTATPGDRDLWAVSPDLDGNIV